MNENIKKLLIEVDVLKEQLSTLRPLPGEALRRFRMLWILNIRTKVIV
jgi:hypothetical protein